MPLTSTEFIVSHVLGASIVLGLHNIYVNAAQFRRVRYKRSPTGLLVTAQLVASISQLINQLFFSVQLTQPIGSLQGCATISDVADVFYFLFQLLSSGVLIVRATVLVPPRYKVLVQAGLGMTLLAGYVPTVMSSIRKQIIVVNGGLCGALYDFDYNNVGKIIFFVLYVMMLCAFSIPALRQLQQATRPAPTIQSPSSAAADAANVSPSADHRTSSSIAAAAGVAVVVLSKKTRSLSHRLSTTTAIGGGSRRATATGKVGAGAGDRLLGGGANASSSTSNDPPPSARRATTVGKPAAPTTTHARHMSAIHKYIRALILTMAFRIFTAIFGYLITVTLSFMGVWPGSLWMVQFTVQNYCAIVASTFAMNSGGGGAAAGAGGGAAGGEKRNNRQVASTATAVRGRAGSAAGGELAVSQVQSRNNPQAGGGFSEVREENEGSSGAPGARDAALSGGATSNQGDSAGRAGAAAINESLISIPSTAMSAMHEDTFAGVSQSALSDARTSDDIDGEDEGGQEDRVQVEIDLDVLAVWNREHTRSKSRSINDEMS